MAVAAAGDDNQGQGFGEMLYEYPPTENITVVFAGIAPFAFVPLDLAKLAKAGGTAIVPGCRNVKKSTFAPLWR